MLGSLPSKDPRSIGGATILTQKIHEYISSNTGIKFVNIRKNWKPKFQIFDFFILLLKFPFVVINKTTVSIHGSKDFHVTVGPLIVIMCKIARVKVIYHFFGGNFHTFYKNQNKLVRSLFNRTILKSDVLLFETKEQVDFFKKLDFNNLIYFPNSRKRPYQTPKVREYHKKFVFISRITPEKGITVIIDAFIELGNDYSIDLYGPINDQYFSYIEKQTATVRNINYKGVLTQENVIEVLENYDILVLPTFYEGEGYPGIILECLSIGIPIITTKWNAIPEIVTNGHNGILIRPKLPKELVKAIKSIDKNNYKDLANNAFESFDQFDSDFVFNKLLKEIVR